MINSFLVMGLVFFLSSTSQAGTVRNLYMNDKKMERINLTLGKSTVLRFNSGRPKKVVVGNNNYYKIEFIGNDVTIQPQGTVPTNLFIYTEYQVYGFILNTRESGYYDDLVNVRWRSAHRRYLPVKKTVATKRARDSLPSLAMKDAIVLEVKGVKKYKDDFYIVGFDIQNLKSGEIKAKNLNIFLTRGGKKLSEQKILFKEDVVKKGKILEGRVFVKLKKKKGFTLNISFEKKKSTIIISRKLL